jgi:hypothetical protein
MNFMIFCQLKIYRQRKNTSISIHHENLQKTSSNDILNTRSFVFFYLFNNKKPNDYSFKSKLNKGGMLVPVIHSIHSSLFPLNQYNEPNVE